MVLDKIGYSIEFAGLIRKKQLKIITKELKLEKQAHKTPKLYCCFIIAWNGKCQEKEVLDNGQCRAHQSKCSCGKLATRECSKAGQFVCGNPLCEDCQCNC